VSLSEGAPELKLWVGSSMLTRLLAAKESGARELSLRLLYDGSATSTSSPSTGSSLTFSTLTTMVNQPSTTGVRAPSAKLPVMIRVGAATGVADGSGAVAPAPGAQYSPHKTTHSAASDLNKFTVRKRRRGRCAARRGWRVEERATITGPRLPAVRVPGEMAPL